MYNDRVLTALVKKYKTSRVRLYGVSNAKGGNIGRIREKFLLPFSMFLVFLYLLKFFLGYFQALSK
jgi:hypothetical protein